MMPSISKVDTSDLASAQKRLIRELRQSGSLNELEKSSNALKLITEAEKNALESERIRPAVRAEAVRFWTPIVASFISALALVATLALQNAANNRNQASQREANEETQWRELLETLRQPLDESYGHQTLVPPSRLLAIQIKSFISAPSAKHRAEAQELALSTLQTSDRVLDPAMFKELISSIDINTQMLPDILDIDRGLAQYYYDTRDKADALTAQVEEEAKLNSAKKHLVRSSSRASRTREQHLNTLLYSPLAYRKASLERNRDGYDYEIESLSRALAVYMRNERNESIDLYNCSLWNADWSTVSFGKAQLEGTFFDNIRFEGADLLQVQSFQGLRVRRSDWWHAKRMNLKLIDYLDVFTKNTPDDEAKNRDKRILLPSDYESSVTSLRARSR